MAMDEGVAIPLQIPSSHDLGVLSNLASRAGGDPSGACTSGTIRNIASVRGEVRERRDKIEG
jgi:hypothetical protein